MSSISYNQSAASALLLLTGSAKALERNTVQVATGRNVNTASDNAAYWSIATSMRSTGMSLSAVEDASGLAAAMTDTASLGMEAATGLVSEIKAKLILARSPGVDRDAINAEIGQLKDQLGMVAESSSFNGENWLSSAGTPSVKSLLASPSTNQDGTTALNTIDFDTASTTLVGSGDAADGLLTKAYSGTTDNGTAYEYYLLDTGSQGSATASEIKISNSTTEDELDGMISATDSMLSSLTSAGAKLGSTSSRISANTEFLSKLQNAIDRGVGRLVDANMEESAVKLAATKVQQQLQTIGLSIVNEQSKRILDLFR
ncbi:MULTISPECIES: flagellin [unclassified Neorhizobium]|uniref:flagellin N-terminal helical domain-containing protein n=1 Tax=unclassified Neorhizobium TaxID=2629175 RepID=UPI001FF14743|nr:MULTISPECIES: flagellin [unclassified Neorhizobium]MCJ9670280.1 flagellar hook associated protein [Neorhizobium sp. SHOUNA12B]MCJ9743517.1 flagellar hook associated protein [Neorhizobium sp. SHOUNA12A]